MNVYSNGVGTILFSLRRDHYSAAIQFNFLEPIIWPSLKYAMGLQEALDMKIKDLEAYGDSILIIE